MPELSFNIFQISTKTVLPFIIPTRQMMELSEVDYDCPYPVQFIKDIVRSKRTPF